MASALAGDILKTFVVGITWGLNQGAHTTLLKMLAQVESAGKKVADEGQKHTQQLKQNWVGLSQEADSASRKIALSIDQYAVTAFRRMAVAAAAAFTAVSGVQAIKAAIDGLDSLNTKAREANTSLEAMANLGAAGKLLGIGETLVASAGAVSQAIKEQRGVLELLKSHGVTEFQDVDKRALQISEMLKRLVTLHGGNEDVARLIGTQIGLSQQGITEHLRADFAAAIARAQELRAAWEGPVKRADEAVQRYKTQIHELSVQVDDFQKVMGGAAAKAFTPFLTALSESLKKNAPQIAGGIDQISEAVGKWSAEKGKEFGDWLAAVSTPGTSENKDFLKKLDDTQKAIRKIGDAIGFVSDKIKQVQNIPTASENVADKVAKGIADFFGSLPVFDKLRDPASKTAQVMARKLIEGQEAERQATLNAIMPLAFGPYGMPIWEEGKTAQPLPPEYKHLEHKTPEELLGGGDHGLQPVPGTVAPRTIAPKPLVPTPPPVPSYLAPSLSSYEGTTPGDHGFSDMGQGRAATPEEIEAAKKQDGAAIKQEKAAETFAKAVEDDRKARQEGGGGGRSGIAGMVQRGLDWLKGLLPGGGGDGMPGGWIDKGGFEGNAAGGGGAGSAGGEGGPTGYTSGGRGGLGALKGKAGERFAEVAPRLMDRLMKEKGLTRAQAAGIVGNLAHESASFTQSQEQNPRGGQGGLGYAQWTGPRRVAFENWAKSKGLDPTSDKASEEYLLNGDPEFAGAVAAVKKTDTVDAASRTFEQTFEKAAADAKHYDRRLEYARRAFTGGAGPVSAEASGTGFDNPVTAGSPTKTGVMSGGTAGRFGAARGGGAGVGLGGPRQHMGQDYRGAVGDTVFPVASGTVESVRGSSITVRHADGSTSTYRHTRPGVQAGQQVGEGTALGEIGPREPGSSAPHLHLERRDPQGRAYDPTTDRIQANAAKNRPAAVDPDRTDRIRANAARTEAPADGRTGAGTPLSSGPVANDNSRTISQVNNFNTKVHASDPKAAASVFKRSNEQLSGMATAQLKSNMR